MSFEQASPETARFGHPGGDAFAKPRAAKRAARPVTQGDFVRPLVMLASLTLLMLTMGVHFSVKAFDRENEVREQILARDGIRQRIEEVALLAIPQTMWDDAVAHLDNRFDPDWAEANIGRYLAQTAGFDRSVVLLGDGAPAYASIGGQTAPVSSYAEIAPKAAPLIADVRALEARRGAVHRGAANTMVSRPIQASSLEIVDGGLVVLTATLVQPDFGKALPQSTGAPIVVTTMQIDPKFLDQFARRYQLGGLHLLPVGRARQPDETAIAMTGYRGQTIADLAWIPANPGYQMLRHSLPPILAVGAALIAIGLFLLRRVQRSAARLIESGESLRCAAFLDRRTSMPNEAHFLDALATGIDRASEAHPLAVHLVEIDELHRVRRNYEPGLADEIMQAACFALQAQCARDSFVAHISDARFAIINGAMTADQAAGFAARLNGPLWVSLFDRDATVMRCEVGYILVSDPETMPLDALHALEAALFAVETRR